MFKREPECSCYVVSYFSETCTQKLCVNVFLFSIFFHPILRKDIILTSTRKCTTSQFSTHQTLQIIKTKTPTGERLPLRSSKSFLHLIKLILLIIIIILWKLLSFYSICNQAYRKLWSSGSGFWLARDFQSIGTSLLYLYIFQLFIEAFYLGKYINRMNCIPLQRPHFDFAKRYFSGLLIKPLHNHAEFNYVGLVLRNYIYIEGYRCYVITYTICQLII